MKPTKAICYNPQFAACGDNHLRWIENVTPALRCAGFADELTQSFDHKGWYIDCYQDDVYRGIVYQLPARRGVAQYLAAYADPYNDNCALVSFDVIHDDEKEAAYAANELARVAAEEAREYNEAWQAGRRFEDLGEEIAETRRETLALLKEARALRPFVAAYETSKVCANLRATVADALRSITHARKERAQLALDFDHRPGWIE